jgi:hypothetical protein
MAVTKGQGESSTPGPTLERVPFGGWENCVRLSNGTIELIATTDVGPRIIHFGFCHGQNLFAVYDEMVGLTGGSEWRSYGGHRLWHAPEVYPRSYAPDNAPISYQWDGTNLSLARTEPENGLDVELVLTLDPLVAQVTVSHKIVNRGPWAIELAPWSISAMAPGGRAIFPQEAYQGHPEALAPARPMVLWSYTDMSDPGWRWGRRFVELRHSTVGSPQKIGFLNSRGWAAYILGFDAFVTRFPFVPGADYPDFGCNNEAFTNDRTLELETLGPIRRLEPGEDALHDIDWRLHRLPEEGDQVDLDVLVSSWGVGG